METCKLLIEHGADVNVKTVRGETPLHKIACGANTEICKLLLEHGADVNVKDKYYNTPLYRATRWGNHKETCDLLKEYGAEDIF